MGAPDEAPEVPTRPATAPSAPTPKPTTTKRPPSKTIATPRPATGPGLGVPLMPRRRPALYISPPRPPTPRRGEKNKRKRKSLLLPVAAGQRNHIKQGKRTLVPALGAFKPPEALGFFIDNNNAAQAPGIPLHQKSPRLTCLAPKIASAVKPEGRYWELGIRGHLEIQPGIRIHTPLSLPESKARPPPMNNLVPLKYPEPSHSDYYCVATSVLVV